MSQNSPLELNIDSTQTACVGSSAAYVLRAIAAAAGSFAPGIHERMFYDLTLAQFGASLDLVERWFAEYQAQLSRMGYRFLFRRVAFRTTGISNWVASGKGYRGAVLPTAGRRLHPKLDIDKRRHAVAITLEDRGNSAKTALTMSDPWPGAESVSPPPEQLETAHRERKYAGLLLFWSGWS